MVKFEILLYSVLNSGLQWSQSSRKPSLRPYYMSSAYTWSGTASISAQTSNISLYRLKITQNQKFIIMCLFRLSSISSDVWRHLETLEPENVQWNLKWKENCCYLGLDFYFIWVFNWKFCRKQSENSFCSRTFPIKMKWAKRIINLYIRYLKETRDESVCSRIMDVYGEISVLNTFQVYIKYEIHSFASKELYAINHQCFCYFILLMVKNLNTS